MDKATGETPNLIGQQLGPYEIQSLLGSGGMASVYRGFDRELQRAVAIKVLSQEATARPGLAEQFRQEARMIAGLHHPHIVQVYSFGQQDGYTYMVQELLPGPTLEQYLSYLAARGRCLDRQDVVSITLQLASALDAAHAAGIVHRDVKPGNALWNASTALVLTDFGVARHMLRENNPKHGMVIGTPHYLSPEQAQGLPVTPASDIYALGVVVYEMIAGRVPFTGKLPVAIITQHIYATPMPLDTLRPDIPSAVYAVIQQALAKDPAERFASAGALARTLKHAWPPAHEQTALTDAVEQSKSSQRERRQTAERLHHARVIWQDTESDEAAGDNAMCEPVTIHSQPTMVSTVEALDTLFPARKLRLVPQPSYPFPQQRRQPAQSGWHILPFVFGTLLLLLIVSGSVVALQSDYQRVDTTVASNDLVAPTSTATIVPTAGLSRQVTVPDRVPTAVPVAATSADQDTAPAPDVGEEPANPASAIEPVALTTAHNTETTVSSSKFDTLRTLIETDSNDDNGWAQIDRTAWVKRLDQIEVAVESGDTQRATVWLDEMRSAFLSQEMTGTPGMADQFVGIIDDIAVNAGITLPSVNVPVVDDS